MFTPEVHALVGVMSVCTRITVHYTFFMAVDVNDSNDYSGTVCVCSTVQYLKISTKGILAVSTAGLCKGLIM